MDGSVAYIAISIGVVAIVAVLAFVVSRGKRQNRLTPLASLAFSLVVAGIIFGDDRLVGYSLMGAGVLLAVLDMFFGRRKTS